MTYVHTYYTFSKNIKDSFINDDVSIYIVVVLYQILLDQQINFFFELSMV